MADKVLLVDDVNMFLELQKGFLQHSAVRILTARNGEEALAVCESERPALVFMDLHMPVMSGADCCKAIKQDRFLKKTPVVLITSEGKDADRRSCLEAGCDEFLTKPLDRQVFLDTARRLLPTVNRRDRRIGCRIKANFQAFGVTLSGFIVDISHGGLYLAGEAMLNQGTMLDLVFALPDPIGSIVTAKGRVAWTNTRKMRRKPCLPEGVGIEFTSVNEEAARELDRFLDTFPDTI